MIADPFPFGSNVKVEGYVLRVKSVYANTVQTTRRDRLRYTEYVGPRWPGEALPDSTTDPEGKHVALIRRMPYTEPRQGVIIGQTWREEGTIHSGAGPSPHSDGEPPFFVPSLRVELYEVAVEDEVSLGRAQIRLVLPDDLEKA